MRIALFGGTFDPPHNGHITIAKAATDTFGLDRIFFAPTGLQPLKLDIDSTPFAIRLSLVSAACKEDPRFIPSAIDSPRSDGTPNYTADTLSTLAAQHSNDTLFNLVGADAFLSIRHWHQSDHLLELAEWIVVTRPGYGLTESDLVPLALTSAQRDRVHILAGVQEDISATVLRERLHLGDPCADLLPAPVAAYIEQHGLYR